MSDTNKKPGWCDTMERPKEACGCPDCGSSVIDIGGMRNTPPTDAMPTLPRTLLNLLGEYGMARSDGVSQVEVTHRWLLVIAGIKRYAAEIAAPERRRDRPPICRPGRGAGAAGSRAGAECSADPYSSRQAQEPRRDQPHDSTRKAGMVGRCLPWPADGSARRDGGRLGAVLYEIKLVERPC